MTFRKERRPLTSTQCNRKKKLANVKVIAVQSINFLHVAILRYNAGPSLRVSAQSHFNSPPHTETRLVLHLSPSLLYRVTDRRLRYCKYHNTCFNPTTESDSVTAGRKILRICFAWQLITCLQGVKITHPSISIPFVWNVFQYYIPIYDWVMQMSPFCLAKIFLLINLFVAACYIPRPSNNSWIFCCIKIGQMVKIMTIRHILSPFFCLSSRSL